MSSLSIFNIVIVIVIVIVHVTVIVVIVVVDTIRPKYDPLHACR